MKKPSLITVILFGWCAVIWTIRAIVEVASLTHNDSVFWVILNILCAIIWIVAFVINLKRYGANKEE